MPSTAPKASSASVNGGRDNVAGGNGGSQDATVAKAVGLVVFSGIAVSIVKSLVSKSGQPQRPPTPFQDLSQPVIEGGFGSGSSSARIIKIEKGDTLWDLSRKYGVSIDVIKEANGITGNTIYAGKKLVIP
ncbi:LysM domain containing protein [Cocos nucifera]|uniref:LysM domain containing protein n=1 Tax=Cocos nucifera TaxID=13894 RepID=A0A8K0NBS5_COCNU|nr:LysM domain containing protein [Cocos nucifera]